MPRRSFEVWNVWILMATIAVALVAVTPYVSVSPVATKTFFLALGTIITVAVYILARLSRGSVIFPPFALLGALWLPVIAYALSALFSGNGFLNALWGSTLEADTFGFVLIAACVGTLTALVLRRTEQYRTFLKGGLGLFALIVVIQAVIIIVGQVSPSTISPSFSIVGTYENLAFILGLGVIGALVTFRFSEVSQKGQRALIATTVVALVLLAVANASFVWIFMALVSLGLFIETVMMRGPRGIDSDLTDVAVVDEGPMEASSTKHPIALPLVVLAVSLFFLIGGTLGSALANALHINVLSVSPSWQSTLSVARQTYTTSPVFGSGPGTFGMQWLKYRDPALNGTVFWNIDFNSGIGFLPTSFVTTGIIGAIAWIAFLALFLVIGIRMLITRTPEDSYARYVAILAFVATLYLFGAAIFRMPGNTVIALAFVFAGLFASTMRYATRGRQWGIIFAKSPRIGFVIVFGLTLLLLSSVVVAYSLVERYVAIVALSQANDAFNAGNVDAADRSIQTAISFAPSAAAYQAQADIAIVQIQRLAASTDQPPAKVQQAFQATLSSGINAALTATRLEPSNYQNWLALGNLYAQAVPLNVSGAYESANSAYEKARALNPTNPQILYIMAQLNIAHNDLKTAENNLKEAVALKPDYTAATFLLSQVEVQSGNLKDALQSALATAYFAPNDPNVLFQVGVLSAAGGDLATANQAFTAAVANDPQFANARYFLAAVLAKQGDLTGAAQQLDAVAALSSQNAQIVAPLSDALKAGKNPFPANLLSATSTPVQQ